MRPIVLLFAAAFLPGCVQGQPAPVDTDHVVIPGPWVFEPQVARIHAGDEMVWANRGGADHTITFDALDVDKTIGPDDEFRYVFTAPGTYHYTCKLHPPDMKGTVIVLPSHDGNGTGEDHAHH